MNSKKQIKKFRKQARRLNDAAESVEALEECRRAIIGLQRSYGEVIEEREEIRCHANRLEETLAISKTAYTKRGDELEEECLKNLGLQAEAEAAKRTLQILGEQLDEARASGERTSNALKDCHTELDRAQSNCATLGDELYEANETIAELNRHNGHSSDKWSETEALLGDDCYVTLGKCDGLPDGRGPYVATLVQTAGDKKQCFAPTINEAVSSLVDSLTAEEGNP